ncbi:MAG: hypothetical protein IKV87_05460 [Methanobrevibacter sp.]|nr:hypothetical protein [Methanobrevibacter sp.]
MKMNKVFIVLLALVLVSSIGMAVAEDASVGPYTFTVPEGYTIATSTDNTVAMQLDENNAVSIATDVSDDLEAAKQNFISQGKELLAEDTIEYNGMEINLQAFSTPGTEINAYNYIVLSEDGNFVVTVATDNQDFDSSLESEDNPAKTIFDTITTA